MLVTGFGLSEKRDIFSGRAGQDLVAQTDLPVGEIFHPFGGDNGCTIS
jgi:hypothetical protein